MRVSVNPASKVWDFLLHKKTDAFKHRLTKPNNI